MPTRSTATVIQIADRRRKVASLYLQQKSQYDIARTLRVNPATVSRDLDAIRQEWVRQAAGDFNAAKAKELARIDWIEREAIEAWQRSKRPAVIETQKEEANPEPAETHEGDRQPPPAGVPSRLLKVVEKVTKKEHRDGSVEYLKVVAWCVEQRCKVWGFDAPKKLEFAGLVAVAVEAAPPQLTADELVLLAEMGERAGLLGPPASDTGV